MNADVNNLSNMLITVIGIKFHTCRHEIGFRDWFHVIDAEFL